MQQTALILGASGRFGRNAATALFDAGWAVRRFCRASDNLETAARDADVIVYAWNPAYPDWARTVPVLHRKVIAAAENSGATVIVPGNVYVFGPGAPGPWSAETPHLARNPLGRIRVEMEAAYRASSAQVILLRAGDFIDTTASGNWFDQVMIRHLHRDRFVYPGDPDAPHAWAYLPDLTRAAVALAEKRAELPRYSDIPFAGYTLTGNDLVQALSQVTGRELELRQMAWWPLQLARPAWRLAPHLLEMRYLWNTPHRLDGARFEALLPGFAQTDLGAALQTAIPEKAFQRITDADGAPLRT